MSKELIGDIRQRIERDFTYKRINAQPGTSWIDEMHPEWVQVYLQLELYEKLCDIESRLDSIDKEIWVRGSGKE